MEREIRLRTTYTLRGTKRVLPDDWRAVIGASPFGALET